MALNNEEIVDWMSALEKESKALKHEVLRLCWAMRGGVSYDEGMLLSSEDRSILNGIITENAEITKKTGLPYF